MGGLNMQDYVKFCKHCNSTKENTILFDEEEVNFYAGYICCMKPEATKNMICPFCKNKLEETIVTEDEIDFLGEASNYNRQFLEAMINLKQSDPIEFQLKMSQFKANLGQQESNKAQTDNKVHCKYCNSTNVKKISGLSKAGSVALWGIFSKKVHNEFHCNNCGADF